MVAPAPAIPCAGGTSNIYYTITGGVAPYRVSILPVSGDVSTLGVVSQVSIGSYTLR